jgi:hypothetical protein
MKNVVVSSVALALAVVSLAGCSRSPRDKIQGRWLGDHVVGGQGAEVAKADGWLQGTKLEFSGNKVTVTVPAERPRTGTFKIASATAAHLAVNFIPDEGAGTYEADFTLADDGTLHWSIGNGREIVLVHAKS